MILAITGHRPHKLGGYYLPNPVASEVQIKLAESLDIMKPEKVLTGMALGVDQWMALICIEKRIPFEAVIPFFGFDSKWPPQSQESYRWLLSKAAWTRTLSDGPYDPALLHQRNEYLVDHCDTLLAVWDGQPRGGTASTVNYAKRAQDRDGTPQVFMLNLPAHIWELAAAQEANIMARKNERKMWAPIGGPPPQLPHPRVNIRIEPPKVGRDNLVFKRFVDVGEEEP